MPITTVQNLKDELGKPGPLSQVLKPEDFVDEGSVADWIATKYKDKLNPTQMRKVFHTFKSFHRELKTKDKTENLPQNIKTRINLLKPNLAYAVGRNEALPKDLYDILKLCLTDDKLQTVADFDRLIDFLSAILAYQKFRKG